MKKLAVVVLSVAFLSAAVFSAFAAEKFPSFSSLSLDGQTVSDAVFADKKLTMINLWGTFCPPCIKEMPDLGKLARSMPEGTQLVGLVLDVEGKDDEETIALAKKIVSQSKADFLHVLPVAEMNSYLRTVNAVPTTIFVDSQGQLVGEPVVGMHSESEYRAELEKNLKTLP